jgi:hypothetical protein
LKRLSAAFAHQDQRAGAVGRLRAVARGDAAARGEHGLELGQAFHRGVGPRALVEVHRAGLDADLGRLEVDRALGHFDRRDLVGELAGLHRGDAFMCDW